MGVEGRCGGQAYGLSKQRGGEVREIGVEEGLG